MPPACEAAQKQSCPACRGHFYAARAGIGGDRKGKRPDIIGGGMLQGPAAYVQGLWQARRPAYIALKRSAGPSRKPPGHRQACKYSNSQGCSCVKYMMHVGFPPASKRQAGKASSPCPREMPRRPVRRQSVQEGQNLPVGGGNPHPAKAARQARPPSHGPAAYAYRRFDIN